MKSHNSEKIRLFGLNVKNIRESKNLTQQNLAGFCDIDIRTIQRIEKGEFSVSLSIIIDLANAFDISINELFPKEIFNF